MCIKCRSLSREYKSQPSCITSLLSLILLPSSLPLSSALPLLLAFCQLAERIKKAPSGPSAISTAEAAFAVFDAEGTGSVSVAVFREIFSKFSDQKIFDEEFIDALVLYADPEMTGNVRYGSLCQRLDADNRIAANALAAAKK